MQGNLDRSLVWATKYQTACLAADGSSWPQRNSGCTKYAASAGQHLLPWTVGGFLHISRLRSYHGVQQQARMTEKPAAFLSTRSQVYRANLAIFADSSRVMRIGDSRGLLKLEIQISINDRPADAGGISHHTAYASPLNRVNGHCQIQ